ncbi:response regulator [Nitratireductor sp. ZSWI3]|uniref:response regulator n=1 Tax=Nitratireductor sp. ZSWI3 TaxID=2966359 RepID=UPI0021501D6C|nr:response regulator [Nitratireductor sp. ZSWI3]MCR4267072.1 response regulator [Nitratireductor sp. ZSWI3]
MNKPLKGARVLLVEDEAMIAMNIEALCREQGAVEVVTVGSFEALEPTILDTHKISSAILDIKVSDRSTEAFARLLQARRIPFIFATGYPSTHHVFEPFPDVRVVEKPYDERDLIEALAQAMALHPTARDRAG